MGKRYPIYTTTHKRVGDDYHEYVSTYEEKNGHSELKIIQEKKSDGESLTIDESSHRFYLTRAFISSCLDEMHTGLKNEHITHLRLIGITSTNIMKETFSSSISGYSNDSAFTNIREVIVERGNNQTDTADKQTTTTLPSQLFTGADLNFVKIDGKQIVPPDFLSGINSLGTLICPDNKNTHDFLTSPELASLFESSQTQYAPSLAQYAVAQAKLASSQIQHATQTQFDAAQTFDATQTQFDTTQTLE